MFRSSRSHMFLKIGVLKNLAVFTGKQLCCSLFLVKACNFINNMLQHRCFLVNAAQFLGTAFFKEHLRRLLLFCKNLSCVLGVITYIFCLLVNISLSLCNKHVKMTHFADFVSCKGGKFFSSFFVVVLKLILLH